MAFKREGTDTALLQDLKRRRIGELLTSHIPEDEALLLKNGLFACTVCPHKPIFNTIEVLAIHRKQNKHLAALSKCLKRNHEAKQAQLSQLPNQSSSSLGKAKNFVITKGQKSESTQKLMKYKPYNSCVKRKVKVNLSEPKKNLPDHREGTVINSYISNLKKKEDFSVVVEQRKKCASVESRTESLVVKQPETSSSMVGESASTDGADTTSNEVAPVDEEKRKRAGHYLRLVTSGWKINREGKWVKDENAEFDSDEEEPPEYPG